MRAGQPLTRHRGKTGARKNLPKTKNPVGKKKPGNLGRNQAQALQPILRGETRTKNYSE